MERHQYKTPVIHVIPVMQENALCGSPVPGGNEDVGYDDWLDNNV